MRLSLPTVPRAPGSTNADPRPPRRTLNIAHRGASALAPENTIAAVRRAVHDGADLVEVDVQRTADGELVLMHDVTLDRTTNARTVYPDRAPWRVSDLTLEELGRLDAGRWKAPWFAGEPVPTLAQTMETLRGSGVGLQLELKLPALHPGVVTDLVRTLGDASEYVEEAAATGRLAVQSFDVAAMKELKTRLPGLPVGLLGRPAKANLPALGTWADQVNPSHRVADQAYVRSVRVLGMSCMVWTVDRDPALRRACRLGVDGVITNRPDRLAAILAG